MALSGVDRGSGGSNTPGTSFTFSPGSDLAAGSLASLFIGYDNSGTNGTDPFASLTDTKGNVWAARQTSVNDPGLADEGVVGRHFTSDMSGGALTTADVITISFGSVSVPAKTWTLQEVVPDAGYKVQYVTGGVLPETTATPSITTGTITINGLVMAAVFREGNETQTDDSDTTNGTWSAAQKAGVGTAAAGQEIITQRKVVTATATQTFNPTYGGVSRDGVDMWVWFTQNKAISPSVGAITTSTSTPNAGVGGVPGTGLINLSGKAPIAQITATAGWYSFALLEGGGLGAPATLSFSPATGVLPVLGRGPLLGRAYLMTLGAVTLTGRQPSILVSTGSAPTGAVTLQGRVPLSIVSAGGGFTSLSLLELGGISMATTNFTFTPGVGSITLTPRTPALYSAFGFVSLAMLEMGGISGPANIIISPPAGTAAYAGQSPFTLRTYQPPTYSVTLQGRTPTVVATTTATMLPYAATVTTLGRQPNVVVSDNLVAAPATAPVLVAGQLPGVARSGQFVFSPAPAGVRLHGREASQPSDIIMVGGRSPLDQTFVGGTALVGGDLDPEDVANVIATPTLALVQITGVQPSLLRGTVIGVPTGAINCTGTVSAIVTGFIIIPFTSYVVIDGQAPNVPQNYILQPAKGAITIGAPPPSFFVGFGFYPGAYALAWTGLVPKANLTITISPDTASLLFNGSTPQLLFEGVEPIQPGAVALAGAAPSVQVDLPKFPSVGSVALDGNAPRIVLGTVIQMDGRELFFTGQEPTNAPTDLMTVFPGVGHVTISGHSPIQWQGTLSPIPGGGKPTPMNPKDSFELVAGPVESFVVQYRKPRP